MATALPVIDTRPLGGCTHDIVMIPINLHQHGLVDRRHLHIHALAEASSFFVRGRGVSLWTHTFPSKDAPSSMAMRGVLDVADNGGRFLQLSALEAVRVSVHSTGYSISYASFLPVSARQSRLVSGLLTIWEAMFRQMGPELRQVLSDDPVLSRHYLCW